MAFTECAASLALLVRARIKSERVFLGFIHLRCKHAFLHIRLMF